MPEWYGRLCGVAACAALISAALSAGGCASASGTSGIPVEQYSDDTPAVPAEYIISSGDIVSIQVWDQPQMSAKVRVRSDGRISLPFVNDMEAEGKTPTKLASDIEATLKSVVLTPKVTVVVEDSKPPTISVIGEVAKPGLQSLERDSGVASALAAAGGFTNFAHRDRIYVIRGKPKAVRIHFTYKALTEGTGPASAFRLRPGDIVVVE
jgi:polysaccharide export outer membrane protein